MPTSKVLFITLDVMPQMTPLTAGYLQGYACLDSEIAASWTFENHVGAAAVESPARLRARLRESNASVYAFSCYAWNMGLVRSVLPGLLESRPDAHVILGGPQVMHCAAKYLDLAHENLVLCNGEGEKTFRAYLAELTSGRPDFSRVKGLSFYRDGELVTTAQEDRIQDLDEIPSPFLGGLFSQQEPTNVVIETNRGCPFRCTYCYWGGAVGAKVNQFSTARIEQELEWISKSRVGNLAIIDANWGMLKRDVDLSNHIVHCKRRFGAPWLVGFSASKNTPERVAEITKIFHDGGLLLSHTISVQTMQESTLENVGRKNIKTKAYISLQQYMTKNEISSHVELIWPLPGETLASFMEGVERLCRLGADLFYCHPLFLINNVELNEHRERFGLVAVPSQDPGSEAEVVIATKDVSRAEHLEGWRFMFATVLLFNLRSLYCLSAYLDRAGLASYRELFASFAAYLNRRAELPLAKLVEQSVQRMTLDIFTLGAVAYQMHRNRAEMDELLHAFVSAQPWWSDPQAQLYFEIDLLNRPSLLLPEIHQPPRDMSHVTLIDAGPGGYSVVLPEAALADIRARLGSKASFQGARVRVDHQQRQLPYRPGSPIEVYRTQSYHSAYNIPQITPTWRDLAPPS